MTGAEHNAPAEPALVIAAAMRLEARALRRRARSAQVVCTGIGPARARKAAATLRGRPERALAVAGVSGALGPGLVPGQLVVVSALYELGESNPPGANEPRWRELASAPKLLEILERSGQPATLGRLATADHVVRGRERGELRETGADIVDMESAQLARGAAGRPFAVLRVVLDTPEQGLVSLSLVRNGLRALRELGAVTPALERWAAECAPPQPPIRRSV